MLPNIGAPELIIILVIALLILGPGKLPDVGASLGKSIREFRKASTDVQDGESSRHVAAAARPRDEPRRSARAPAQPARRRDPPPSVAPATAAPAAVGRDPAAPPTTPDSTTTSPARRARADRSMADADALLEPASPGVPSTPDPVPPPAPLRPATSRSCRSSTTSASCGRGCSGASSRSASAPPSASTSRPRSAFLSRRSGDTPLQVLGLGDAFAIRLQISIVIGIILAMPVLL